MFLLDVLHLGLDRVRQCKFTHVSFYIMSRWGLCWQPFCDLIGSRSLVGMHIPYVGIHCILDYFVATWLDYAIVILDIVSQNVASYASYAFKFKFLVHGTSFVYNTSTMTYQM